MYNHDPASPALSLPQRILTEVLGSHLQGTSLSKKFDSLIKRERKELLDIPEMTANVLLFGKHHSDYMATVDFTE